ncbi:MAG: hypothetical protein HGB06_12040, partial [Chlorobaculum sp.]|nr:hypothetical protein [Chlorobaculum sp.]
MILIKDNHIDATMTPMSPASCSMGDTFGAMVDVHEDAAETHCRRAG